MRLVENKAESIVGPRLPPSDSRRPILSPAMALQPCRATLGAGRHVARSTTTPCLRSVSTARHSNKLIKPAPENPPAGRWSQTPPAMKAPMRMNIAKDEANRTWVVNYDPKRLDDMYDRLLGPGGADMLPNELKWQAVTHKSFDYGRRGFNDRLALLGMLPRPALRPPCS